MSVFVLKENNDILLKGVVFILQRPLPILQSERWALEELGAAQLVHQPPLQEGGAGSAGRRPPVVPGRQRDRPAAAQESHVRRQEDCWSGGEDQGHWVPEGKCKSSYWYSFY